MLKCQKSNDKFDILFCFSFRLGDGHKENNSIENFNNLQIWQGNIPEAIEHAVKNKCLTESLVAMSPIGMSQKLLAFNL